MSTYSTSLCSYVGYQSQLSLQYNCDKKRPLEKLKMIKNINEPV